MAGREPTAGRRGSVREPLRRVLVVCGAERTEVAYLKGLRDHLKTPAVNIRVIERAAAPDQVVEYARDHCGREDFDETWCVVDVDHFEREGGRVSAARQLAEKCGIRVAVSNPCFEYWLLLHHEETSAPFSRCDGVVVRIRRHVRSYDKTRLRFADFADGVEDAVVRARRREPTGEDSAVNPSTGVWRLVSTMTEGR